MMDFIYMLWLPRLGIRFCRGVVCPETAEGVAFGDTARDRLKSGVTPV
jgi:hypothetical protein